MTTIEGVKALADDLLCAAAVDEVDSARQKFEDAIDRYAAELVAAEREQFAPIWPRRCELATDIGRAYSNGWNECLSDCIRAFAAAIRAEPTPVAKGWSHA